MKKPLAICLLSCAFSTTVLAQEAPPQMGRYMPLYPGLYFQGGYAQDERDASYDRQGRDRNSAVPTVNGRTAFPEKSISNVFTWHFPMFESQNLTFFSSRTHLARVTLRYVDTETEGALAAFIQSPPADAPTETTLLRNSGSGVGDLTAEFGSFLYGASTPGWRERERTPFAVVALIGLNVPFGVYDRNAPANAGSNTTWIQGRLGVHWQPWLHAFVDAGAGYRKHYRNYDPSFGALAPAVQGDEISADLSLAHRVLPGLYATAFAQWRDGDANQYQNPRFAPNAPPADDQNPLLPEDNFPTPGTYFDDGTGLTVLGLSLKYFISQRWLAALHYSQPRSGKSGQFLLPFTNREPAGCTIGTVGCTTYPGDTVLVDGLGPARSYSSDRLMLSLSYNFGLGDAFTCTGCKQ
jgi:hypothetical protein